MLIQARKRKLFVVSGVLAAVLSYFSEGWWATRRMKKGGIVYKNQLIGPSSSAWVPREALHAEMTRIIYPCFKLFEYFVITGPSTVCIMLIYVRRQWKDQLGITNMQT